MSDLPWAIPVFPGSVRLFRTAPVTTAGRTRFPSNYMTLPAGPPSPAPKPAPTPHPEERPLGRVSKDEGPTVASWFETREEALLTMRNRDMELLTTSAHAARLAWSRALPKCLPALWRRP